jgi:hypothetical protein
MPFPKTLSRKVDLSPDGFFLRVEGAKGAL